MDPGKVHQKVVVIRLPASFAGKTNLPLESANQANAGSHLTDINQIPDEIIAEMVSNQYKHRTSNVNTIADTHDNNPNIMIDNTDPNQLAMYSTDHPELAPSSSTQASHNNHHQHDNNNSSSSSSGGGGNSNKNGNKNSNNSNNEHHKPVDGAHYGAETSINSDVDSANEHDESGEKETGEQSVQYKNYTPKQREWMLVVLSYSRGLLGKPFEMKLQDVVIEKAREVLKKNGPIFKLNDRIPTPRTLRGIWKNLWKHPERTVGNVNKGGRPRIDPALKRQKRNEREKWRRAALKQSKQLEALQAAGSGANHDYHQMELLPPPPLHQQPLTPRRSQRGQ